MPFTSVIFDPANFFAGRDWFFFSHRNQPAGATGRNVEIPSDVPAVKVTRSAA